MIIPGTTYMVTRRTTQRMFLLRPSKAVNQTFRYCLALAAGKTGVQVHAYVVMSNHYHIVCTDPNGALPRFVEELNRLVARALNCHYGRWENFWAGGAQTSYVTLADADAVLDKMTYTLANCVTAGLVAHGKDWPGERLYRPGTYQARRPTFFFRQQQSLPKTLRLELTAPPALGHLDDPTATVQALVRAREAAVRAQRAKARRRFVGAAAVRAQRPTDSPTTREPRRGLSPRVACRDKWRRIELLQRLKSFVPRYKDALLAWTQGLRDTVFPPGVYLMRVRFDVCCAET